MHIDPALPVIVGAIFAILAIGLIPRALRQPQIVGYIIAGLVIGPFGIGPLEDPGLIGRVGGIGLIVLLFFVCTEASPGRLPSPAWIGLCKLVLGPPGGQAGPAPDYLITQAIGMDCECPGVLQAPFSTCMSAVLAQQWILGSHSTQLTIKRAQRPKTRAPAGGQHHDVSIA